MKIRKSTSLMAGACTLCIAAASGTIQPQAVPAAAPQESVHRVVSQEVMLAASPTGLLGIPQLLLQQSFLVASTVGLAATAWVPGVNAATGAFITGQWQNIPIGLMTATTAELTALSNLAALPSTLITQWLTLLGSLGGALAVSPAAAIVNPAATVDPAAAPLPAASTPTGLLGIPQLLLQQSFLVASTLGLAATAWVPGVNAATGAFITGQWQNIPTGLMTAVTAELTALGNLAALPSTLITQWLTLLGSLGGALAVSPAAATVTPAATVNPALATPLALNTGGTTNTVTDTNNKNGTDPNNKNGSDPNNKNGTTTALAVTTDAGANNGGANNGGANNGTDASNGGKKNADTNTGGADNGTGTDNGGKKNADTNTGGANNGTGTNNDGTGTGNGGKKKGDNNTGGANNGTGTNNGNGGKKNHDNNKGGATNSASTGASGK